MFSVSISNQLRTQAFCVHKLMTQRMTVKRTKSKMAGIESGWTRK